MNTTKKAIVDTEQEIVKDTISIKFKTPLRNRNISPEMFKAATKAYLDDIEKEHGKRMAFPNEYQMIMFKVQEMYGEPYIYQTDMIYEITKEDAEFYLDQHKVIINTDKQRYIKDVKSDLHRFQEKYYYAERA